MPTINGYVEMTAGATDAGAPIDAFQAQTWVQNDITFEKYVRGLLASPLVPNAMDGGNVSLTISNVADVNQYRVQILNMREIILDHDLDLLEKVPLIWFAKERIFIKKKINGVGKGAKNGEKGDFGGAGGGGTGAEKGESCVMPVTEVEIISEAAGGANGGDLKKEWATRLLSVLALAKGGASGGGGNGGAGGGIVILCAPKIEFDLGNGEIDCSGAPSTAAGDGGGGGGSIILIANEYIDVHDTGGSQNLKAEGGTKFAGGTGGNGGKGQVIKFEYI